MKVRPGLRLKQRRNYIAASVLVVSAAIGMAIYFQLSKPEKIYAGTTTNYYSIKNGDWTDNVWSTTSSDGSKCGCNPGSGPSVVESINIYNTITMNDYAQFQLSGGAVINVMRGGSLTINAKVQISSSSQINVATGGSVVINGNLQMSASAQVNDTGSFNVSGNVNLSGGATVCGNGSQTYSGSLTGSGWCPSTLPVELLYFRATANGNQADLTWATASQINNNFFTIERASPLDPVKGDQLEFNAVTTIQGAGNSTVQLNYHYTDDAPLTAQSSGIVYYRLKQTDYDGRFTYSSVQTVYFGDNRNGGSAINIESISPNPFKNNFIIYYNAAVQNPVDIQMLNYQGQPVSREIMNANKGLNNYFFADTKGLPCGIYIVRIETGGQVVAGKLLKQ